MLDDLNCDFAGPGMIEGTALRPIALLPGFFVDLGIEGVGPLVLVADVFDPSGVFGFGTSQT
jgi:hypothetical protein